MDKFITVANKIGLSIDNPIANRMIQKVSVTGAKSVIAHNSNRNRPSTSNNNRNSHGYGDRKSYSNGNSNCTNNHNGNFNSNRVRLSFENYHTISTTKLN